MFFLLPPLPKRWRRQRHAKGAHDEGVAMKTQGRVCRKARVFDRSPQRHRGTCAENVAPRPTSPNNKKKKFQKAKNLTLHVRVALRAVP